MLAHVVKRSQLIISSANNKDALFVDGGRQVITAARYLTVVACIPPAFFEDRFYFVTKDFFIEIKARGQRK